MKFHNFLKGNNIFNKYESGTGEGVRLDGLSFGPSFIDPQANIRAGTRARNNSVIFIFQKIENLYDYFHQLLYTVE